MLDGFNRFTLHPVDRWNPASRELPHFLPYNLGMSFGQPRRSQVWIRVAAALTLLLFVLVSLLRRTRLW